MRAFLVLGVFPLGPAFDTGLRSLYRVLRKNCLRAMLMPWALCFGAPVFAKAQVRVIANGGSGFIAGVGPTRTIFLGQAVLWKVTATHAW